MSGGSLAQQQIRNFARFLQEIADGKLEKDLTHAMRDLIGDIENAAMERGGKAKGSITLKIQIKKDRGAFDVEYDFDTKAPKPVNDRTVFFATADNLLSRMDPRQQEMKFRDVNNTGGFREADEPAEEPRQRFRD